MVVNAVVIMMIYGEVVRVDGEEDESVFYTKPAGMAVSLQNHPTL